MAQFSTVIIAAITVSILVFIIAVVGIIWKLKTMREPKMVNKDVM